MKARIKATGEIVDVLGYEKDGSFIDLMSDGMRWSQTYDLAQHSLYNDFELFEGTVIDWEERRYQIAKDILVNFAISNELRVLEATSYLRAKWAIDDADELIKRLKGE